MRLMAAEEESPERMATATAEIHLPAEINWEMLDKWRFFALGAALFSGVSAALYPAVVLKTHQQVSPSTPLRAAAAAIFRRDGPRGFYRGFATSLAGTVPARAFYMGALETTKSAVSAAAADFGVPEPAASTVACAAAGISAAIAAQLVWTPVDVISQRLMIQGGGGACHRYSGGIDAFKKIVFTDGIRGLYRGFGVSLLTYAPSNAIWWSTYSIGQRLIWSAVGCSNCVASDGSIGSWRPDGGAVVAVQGASAALAGGVAAVVTMPLDTIKTRMQVMDGREAGDAGYSSVRCGAIGRTVRGLLRDGGWSACYRGLGPRWASMSLSATTMITTYEFIKRMSAKEEAV